MFLFELLSLPLRLMSAGLSRALLSALALLSFLLVGSAPCQNQQDPSLRVTVVDSQGAAVPLAEVHVIELPGLVGIPTPNGKFSFKGVPPGTYQISAKYPGFRDEVSDGVVVVGGKITELSVVLEQAPPKASDYRIHQELRDARLYSKHLTELGQPLLCPVAIPDNVEWYRFMWVPTFAPPVFLRIDIEEDGTATLGTYVWKGQGGYDWGKPAHNVRKLTLEEENELFATLADIGFWHLPAEVENPPNLIVLDGTEWFIEGVKNGECHVVTRDSTPLTGVFSRQFLAGVAKLRPYYSPDR